MMDEIRPVLNDFVVTLLTGVLTLLGAFLVALAKKGFDWLNKKIESIQSQKLREDAAQATSMLQSVVTTTVEALQQSLGDDIRESIAKGDGKYTKEDLKALKNEALESVKHQLSAAATQILESVYTDLDSYICDLIEAAVLKLKSATYKSQSSKKLLNE